MSWLNLFIYLLNLKSYKYDYPRQPHRVTSGLFTKSNLTQVEHNTKHAHFTSLRKTYKHNPKVSPFGIALVKNGKQKLGENK